MDKNDLIRRANLKVIPPYLHNQAIRALEERDGLGFLFSAGNTAFMALVVDNLRLLKELGIYEETLLQAFTGVRGSLYGFSLKLVQWIFDQADSEKIRAASDPLPGPGPFTLYRGVSGRGRARRVNGLSWTGSLEKAKWFANRLNLENPGVYRIILKAEYIFAYSNTREEDEFIVSRLPEGLRPRRLS